MEKIKSHCQFKKYNLKTCFYLCTSSQRFHKFYADLHKFHMGIKTMPKKLTGLSYRALVSILRQALLNGASLGGLVPHMFLLGGAGSAPAPSPSQHGL